MYVEAAVLFSVNESCLGTQLPYIEEVKKASVMHCRLCGSGCACAIKEYHVSFDEFDSHSQIIGDSADVMTSLCLHTDML